MVLKLHKAWFYSALVFENDVKMYGTQTLSDIIISYLRFENDVKMYGTQTYILESDKSSMFENDVKMYGTQTRETLL